MNQSQITAALEFAQIYDKKRHCGWNDSAFSGSRGIRSQFPEDIVCARDIPEFASMGGGCHGTILELALLTTLEPCKECGGDYLYAGDYWVACCTCAGPMEEPCEDCQDGGCRNYIENSNLQDAITAWNLTYGAGQEAKAKWPLTIIH